MDKLMVPNFKEEQDKLLVEINNYRKRTNHEILKACKMFLGNQCKQLDYLRHIRQIHRNEQGKVNFRLTATERVSLLFLDEKFTEFALCLENCIQTMSRMIRMATPSNSTLSTYLKAAQDIGKEMLKICVVLDHQPVCFHYEKQSNEVPNLIFLGTQCLSNVEISDISFDVVSQSELEKAWNLKSPLEQVEQISAVVWDRDKRRKTEKDKGASTDASKVQGEVRSLGFWYIPKTKFSSTQNRKAHVNFLRLRYVVQMKYNNSPLDSMILSLPFLIRKGSAQIYTFAASLMWYFYKTDNPFENFKILEDLTKDEMQDMLVSRIESIGRPLSETAKTFFKARVEKVSHNNKVSLEVLAKCRAAAKEDDNKQEYMADRDNPEDIQDVTRSVDESIEYYGLSIWFYGLARSLDVNGFLHDLWMARFIYDICEVDDVVAIVEEPNFPYGTVILRPSMSEVHNYKAENISMGLAFFYKDNKNRRKAFSIRVRSEEVEHSGLIKPLTFLGVEHVYFDCLANMKPVRTLPDYLAKNQQYHKTPFNLTSVPQTQGTNIRHCRTCACEGQNSNREEATERELKRMRYPSENSEHSAPSPGQLGAQGAQKRKTPLRHADSPGLPEHRGVLPYGTDEQGQGPRIFSPHRDHESSAGSPDSGVCELSPTPLHYNFYNACSLDQASAREERVAKCQQAFNTLYQTSMGALSDDSIDRLTNLFREQALQSFPSSPNVISLTTDVSETHLLLNNEMTSPVRGHSSFQPPMLSAVMSRDADTKPLQALSSVDHHQDLFLPGELQLRCQQRDENGAEFCQSHVGMLNQSHDEFLQGINLNHIQPIGQTPGHFGNFIANCINTNENEKQCIEKIKQNLMKVSVNDPNPL